jgi:hypothetical protein
MEPIIIPPIRTCLEDIESVKSAGRADNPPRTEKAWWLYWQRSGEKLAGLVTSGTHANRPDPNAMPDGALYTETDRGYVVYENVSGAWQYVAGTMWGTLNPDERPTDLGVNDAGFDFRATDVAREFLWSQSQWIEVTAVQYGLHAARPAPLATADGVLYAESDRGGVIYQLEAGVWKYRTGTMYGTLSPDQRPTDLGVDDGGFDFRGTDQQREFIWSQTAWIETTPPPVTFSQPARADGVVYQNTNLTPQFVSINFTMASGNNPIVYCDNTASPTTVIANLYISGSVANMSVFFIVLPKYYYTVTLGGAGIYRWSEWN